MNAKNAVGPDLRLPELFGIGGTGVAPEKI
jgi:hypothetical protein